MRSGLIWLHKYTGLILGLLLSITGLSGSLVVFDRELDEWLTPETVDFEPSQTLAPYNVAVAQAKQALGTDAEPTRLMTGRHAGAPHIIRFPTPENAPGPIEVSVNPVTGDALAVRNWGQYPVTWFYRLHLSFLGGERGEVLVGIMGFCMLFFCISGVIIWWPKLSRQGKRDWWRAFTIKRRAGWFRLNFDVHKTVGIYFLPVFIMLAVTGIEIVWHDPFRQVVATVFPVQEEPSPQSTPLDTPALSMDEAAAAAQQVYPQSRIARLYVPGNETAPWRVTFIHPDDWWTEYSGTMVYLDQYNGEVLAVWDSRELPLGNKMLAWFFPLHNGDALSLLGRIIVFVAGLLPSLLFGTGVYMWWRKRRGVRR